MVGLGLHFWIIDGDPPFISDYDLLQEMWFIGSSLIKSLANAVQCSFSSASRSQGTKFATTHFMPRSCIKISDTVVLGIPRSPSSSHTVGHRSLWIAARTGSTFSGVLLVAGLPEHASLPTGSQPCLKCSCCTFICTILIASSPKAF